MKERSSDGFEHMISSRLVRPTQTGILERAEFDVLEIGKESKKKSMSSKMKTSSGYGKDRRAIEDGL
jgi:hypothetical protein